MDSGTTIMNIIRQTKLSSMTRQYFARLMRPAKPKKKFQSIAQSPDGGNARGPDIGRFSRVSVRFQSRGANAGLPPSGSGPYWFGPGVPGRQPSSTKAQIKMANEASERIKPPPRS